MRPFRRRRKKIHGGTPPVGVKGITHFVDSCFIFILPHGLWLRFRNIAAEAFRWHRAGKIVCTPHLHFPFSSNIAPRRVERTECDPKMIQIKR
jgi:hypothetical protein